MDREKLMHLLDVATTPEPNTGCLLWMRSVDKDGYAIVKEAGKQKRIARLVCEAFHGPMTSDQVARHSCDLSGCVEPPHLSPGSMMDNARDRVSRGRSRGRGGKCWSTTVFTNQPKKALPPFSQERVKSLVNYDPETGLFTWRQDAGMGGRYRAGDSAGWIDKGTHYPRLYLDGGEYLAHRIAVFYMTGAWPTEHVDHINRVRADNRWANLRCATQTQNNQNISLKRNNKSCVTGVSWDSARGKWVASITANSKSIALGRFETFEDAVEARRAGEQRHHGKMH